MTEDTNGLSREQVEALAEAMLRAWDDEPNPDDEGLEVLVGELIRHVAPTVAAMLAEARAEVVRAVEREYADEFTRLAEVEKGDPFSNPMLGNYLGGIKVARDAARESARNMPSAVREGGTERSGASGGSAVEVPADFGPLDGRTEPRIVWERQVGGEWQEFDRREIQAGVEYVLRSKLVTYDPTCGEALGDMRCQLRRGHDGGHEDYSAVAQERRG